MNKIVGLLNSIGSASLARKPINPKNLPSLQKLLFEIGVDVNKDLSNPLSFYRYNQLKADLFEEIAAWFLGAEAHVVGKVVQELEQESGGKLETFQVQLAQDVVVGLKGNNVFDRLVKALENNKFSTTVITNSELRQLNENMGSLLRVQVKSGHLQDIINNNARYGVSLENIEFDVAYPAIKELYALYSEILRQKRATGKDVAVPAKHSELAALTNWQLSKQVHKTGLRLNDLYFTENGFETVGEWMKRRGRFVKFSHDIHMISRNSINEFLPKRRQIMFRSLV